RLGGPFFSRSIIRSEKVYRTPTLVDAELPNNIRCVIKVVVVLFQCDTNIHAAGGSEVVTDGVDLGVVAEVVVFTRKRAIPKGSLDTHVEAAELNECLTNVQGVCAIASLLEPQLSEAA